MMRILLQTCGGWMLLALVGACGRTPVGCELEVMTGSAISYEETTQGLISGSYVGVGNPSRTQVPNSDKSAPIRPAVHLYISDHTAKRDELVAEGSAVLIGADRYCVVDVDVDGSGPSGRGTVTLRKLAEQRP
jgi:hypothetical protein